MTDSAYHPIQDVRQPVFAAARTNVLRRLLAPAPDSLILTSSTRHRPRWIMLWNLIWIPFVFGDVLFGMPLPPHWWPITLGALAAFLLLYLGVNVSPARHRFAYALAIVALACLVMPVAQYASGTFLIYGCAYLSLRHTLRQALACVVPAMAVWALETQALGWPWQAITWVLVVSLAISVGQYSMWSTFSKNAELRLSHDEIRRLAASAERERIGRDLHDLLGHTLSMVALKSELAGRLIERDPRAARREMADVERVARDALSQVRSAVSGIRAAALAAELASARLLLETAGVHVDYFNDGHELPPDAETCLAMVLREAVTNIQRHARANSVEVSVIAGSERAVMRVRDDGRGGVGAYGNGLTGMRERIVARGGEIWIDSPQGHGTVLEVRLPLSRQPAGSDPRKIVPISMAVSAQRAEGRA